MIGASNSENQVHSLALGAGLLGALLIIAFYFRFSRKKNFKKEGLENKTSESAVGPSVSISQEMKTPEASVSPLILGDLLKNTRQGIVGRIRDLFSTETGLAQDKLAELEEILFTSDLGPQTVEILMGAIAEKSEKGFVLSFDNVKLALREQMQNIFSKVQPTELRRNEVFAQKVPKKPWVWMIVGVNGVGKTTTIGKLAQKFSESGKKVLIGAADTFRAAAQDQLAIWSKRAQAEIHSPLGVTDPSAVAFESCEKAKHKDFDVVLIDTAGRLHTKSNLMEELKKMKRVIAKAVPDAPHEILLVVDANTGQNALNQARTFHEALGVTGVVLTKLDGTAKGGVAVGIACELQIPIVWIGVGEKAQDLKVFQPQEFVESII